MKAQIFKRSKKTWTNEQEALQDVTAKQGIQEVNLKPVHTDKAFAWEVVTATNEDTFVIAIADVENHSEAVAKAMEHLNTFEANLKPAHTETDYIFTKVRG